MLIIVYASLGAPRYYTTTHSVVHDKNYTATHNVMHDGKYTATQGVVRDRIRESYEGKAT